MKKAIVLLLTLVLLQGCAAVQWIEKHPATAGLIVRHIVLKKIDDNTATAQEIYNVTSKLQRLAPDQWATLDELEVVAHSVIPWHKLDRADTMLAEDILAWTKEELGQFVGEGLLDPDERVLVSTFIGWVQRAAVLAGAR